MNAAVPSNVLAANEPVFNERGLMDAKIPPEWNHFTPLAKIPFQSKSPGFSSAAASLARL